MTCTSEGAVNLHSLDQETKKKKKKKTTKGQAGAMDVNPSVHRMRVHSSEPGV